MSPRGLHSDEPRFTQQAAGGQAPGTMVQPVEACTDAEREATGIFRKLVLQSVSEEDYAIGFSIQESLSPFAK